MIKATKWDENHSGPVSWSVKTRFLFFGCGLIYVQDGVTQGERKMKRRNRIFDTLLIYCVAFFSSTTSQLVINVKNQGGDVLQESLLANITEETVQLDFQRPDGTFVSQLLDFQREVQIFRLVLLTEEEQVARIGLPLPQYHTVCFVLRLAKQDFIAADAIAKLRQKNPNTVRIPEEDSGKDNVTFNYIINLEKADVISPYIRVLCQEAKSSIYVLESDVRFWAAPKDPSDAAMIVNAINHVKEGDSLKRCKETATYGDSCNCRLEFCIPWYPCGLKFCRGHDASGKALSYRCGIKTCKKCLNFHYPISLKGLCLWDD